MFLIPWGTDAPIYHFPWATIGLIVLSTLVMLFVGPADRIDVYEWDQQGVEAGMAPGADGAAAQQADDVRIDFEHEDEGMQLEHDERAQVARIKALALSHGKGLHPLQWVTSNFVHGNWLHLIGNMLFLWVFGIIVEGKIGWLAFLGVYLGLGAAECGVEQAIAWSDTGGFTVGASAVLYGLMTMCLVWAPKNDIHCYYYLCLRPRGVGDVDVPIVVFAILYCALEAVLVFVSGFALSASLWHLLGAVGGLGLGTLLLRRGWVDCEGWDVLTVINRRRSKKKKKRRRKNLPDAGAPSPDEQEAIAVEQLRRALAEGHAAAAMAMVAKARESFAGWEPPEPELLGLIKLLQVQELQAASVPWMEDYIRLYPGLEKTHRMRLKLAQVLVRDQARPVQALRVLAQIPPGALPASLEPARRQIERKAMQLRDDGVVELQGG